MPESNKIVFDTFKTISKEQIQEMKQPEPSFVDGRVSVVRYRVTIEIINEPYCVVRDRIADLRSKCSNAVDRGILDWSAEILGVELNSELEPASSNDENSD